MNKTLSLTLTFLMLAFLVLTPALAQEGPDEYEPNDSDELADLIDDYIFSGIVGGKGDTDDWFQLDGQEGFNPGFTLYYNDAVCDIDMEVWSGDEIVGSLTATHSPDYGEFYVPETCWIHVWAHSNQGEYTIEIHTDGGYDGDYDFGPCEGLDEIESNDTRDLADFIEYTEFEGYVCDGDSDWFVLDGQEGFVPNFTLYYDDDYVDVDMDIYSDNDLVGSLTGTSGEDSGIFEVPGTCYLNVYSYDGEGWYMVTIDEKDGGGTYRPPVSNDCEGDDEFESNDSRDLADSIDGYMIDGYACNEDVDWFRLEGQEGTSPTIILYYDSRDIDVDMEIYSGYDIAGSLTSSSDPDEGTFNVPDTCYLKVYSYDGDGYYSIEILPQGGGYSNYNDCEGPDEVESNDSRGLADSINYYLIEGYACSGDDDWFELTGQEGSRPTFTLYYDEDVCDIDMEVYSGTDYIGSLTSTSSPDYDTFSVPGKCYLHVYSHSGEGFYSIDIEP